MDIAGLKSSIAAIVGDERRVVRTDGGVFDLGAAAIDECLGAGVPAAGLHEVRCGEARDIAAACGFVACLLARYLAEPSVRAGRVVWVSDPASEVDGGVLFPDGLAEVGLDPALMVFVRARTLADALWAANEAAGTGAVGAVVLHIKGNPARFDMTESRRLMLRAQASGVPVIVLRQSGREEAGSARGRWCVVPQASSVLPLVAPAPLIGQWRQRLVLERNRAGRTGEWVVSWNRETKSFEDVTQAARTTHTGTGADASVNGPGGKGQVGAVVALGRAS